MVDRIWGGQAEELLKVPGPPAAPFGDPTSVEVFRPGRGFLRYRIARWFLGEGWAIGIAIVTIFFPQWIPDVPVLRWLKWDFLHTLEWLFLLVLPIYLPISMFLIHLDYRNRWYVLTDRSLRIREGVWIVREMTISLANVQNVSMSQGPIQRIFGIAEVDVSTAGGGELDLGDGNSMHRGVLRGVENADKVRDRIVRSWNQARERPAEDDVALPVTTPANEAPADRSPHPLLTAASGLASEARLLRARLEARSAGRSQGA